MPRPNVILIQADDHRFDAISAAGGQVDTPNLDRLVSVGTTFSNAHNVGSMHVAVCMPSRAMLLTGRSLFSLSRHGGVLPPDRITLPEIFRSSGYLTCQIGKWHHDRASHGRLFDTGRKIFGFAGHHWYQGCNGHWHTPVSDWDPTGEYPPEKGYFDPPLEPFAQPYERVKANGRHSAAVFTDAAIEFLKERETSSDGKPFFLLLTHLAPHDPRQYPVEFGRRYPRDKIELPPNFTPTHLFDNGEMSVRDELLEGQPRQPEAIQQCIADYMASVAHLDSQIGRLLQALSVTPFGDNTIVIYTSDHGLACGQHGLLGKQNLYDHSLRVPLIMAGPGIPRGLKHSGLCYLMDLNPTLCELAGLIPAANLDAHSLVPSFNNSTGVIREALHFAYRGVQRGVRVGNFKLIEYVVAGRRATQLFDLAADPHETRNLAVQPGNETRILELRNRLRQWQTNLGDTQSEGLNFWRGFESKDPLPRWKPGMNVHEPV